MKYLTNSGLSYFLNKIKAYISSVLPTKTSDLTNDSGFLTSHQDLSGYVPRSGGAVMTGSLLGRTVDNDSLRIDGGTDYDHGASIGISGKDRSGAGGVISLRASDGSQSNNMILKPDGTATWGGKNLAMQEDTVPCSGGAVIIPNTIFGCVNNFGYLRIYGGVDGDSGASFQVNGKDTSGNKGHVFITANNGTRRNFIEIRPDGDTILGNCLIFYPGYDNTTYLGAANYRWKTVYSATSTINTSDLRLKNTITDIDDSLLDAWENIQPKQYKFNDATETKGEQARFHTGYIAQDIEKACADNNIDATRYGLFCFNSWDEQPEVTEDVEVEKDGVKTTETRIVQEKRAKGDIYSLRYEEALVVECAYLRRENSRLKENLASIEERLEKLEKSEK